MNPLSDITNAPVLYSTGDKTYEVSALDHGDLGAFCRFVQFDEYYTLKAMPDIPQAIIDKALQDCAKKPVTLGDDAFNSVDKSPRGQAEYAYLALKHRQPSITRQEVNALPIDDVVRIAGIAMILSQPVDVEKKVKALAILTRKTKPADLTEPLSPDSKT